MNKQDVIKDLEETLSRKSIPKDVAEFVKICLTAVKESAAHECHEPLSVDELRQRNGKPVFIMRLSPSGEVKSHWAIVDIYQDSLIYWKRGIRAPLGGESAHYIELPLRDYGDTWETYDNGPKEAQHE